MYLFRSEKYFVDRIADITCLLFEKNQSNVPGTTISEQYLLGQL